MSDDQTLSIPINEATLRRLGELHGAVLRLHKALLDSERAAYETIHGPVSGAGHLLNLVMTDPWFDWLHQISRLIVRIDELTESEEATLNEAFALFEDARALFRTTAEPTEFMNRYKAVLQRDPASVQAHFDLQRVLLSDA